MLKRLRLPDFLYKYTGAAIIILVPLYPKFPLLSISGTFVAIRFEDIVLAVAGILVFAAYLPKIKYLFRDKVTFSILLFLLIGLLSLLSAAFVTHTIELKIGFLHWIRRIEYLIPFFLGMEIIDRKIKVSFYFKLILIVIFIAFIYGLGQKNFNWPVIITQNEEYSRGVALRYIPGGHINSTFAGHYDLATFFVMVLPIVVTAFFVMKGRVSKLILASVFFSGMWLLVNSASRISLFSYFFAVSAALFFIRKYKAIIPVLLVSALFVTFSSNLLGRYTRLLDVVKEKFVSTEFAVTEVIASSDFGIRKTGRLDPTPTPIPPIEDRSTNIRLNVEWPRAIRAFYKNPLLGTGYSSITLATDNDYLRVLGETGIMGLFTFFLVFLRIVIRFLKKYPFYKFHSGENLAFTAGIFGSLPGLFTNALFIDIFEASKFAIIFWFLVGLGIKLTEEKKE